jgi:hypothetical protein
MRYCRMRLTITSNTHKCPDGNILKRGEIVVNDRCCGFGRIPRAARAGLYWPCLFSFEQQVPRAGQRPGHSVTSLRAISRLPAKAYRAPADANG